MNSIREWKNFLNDHKNKISLLLTLIILIFFLVQFSKFLLFIEQRQGVVLNDPILNCFNAVDLNYPIFIIVYASILFGLIYLFNYPDMFIIGLQSYILLIVFRIISMYIVPLDPPSGTIDLQDPLVFVIGTGTKITKDLFFSGHTSTIFLIFLCVKNKLLKSVFLVLAIILGILLLIQKVHYSIDVMVAPFYSYTAFKIISLLHKKYS